MVPGVVAVGATDSKDQRARYSNYGRWVSVTAPGHDASQPLIMYRRLDKLYNVHISITSAVAPAIRCNRSRRNRLPRG